MNRAHARLRAGWWFGVLGLVMSMASVAQSAPVCLDGVLRGWVGRYPFSLDAAKKSESGVQGLAAGKSFYLERVGSADPLSWTLAGQTESGSIRIQAKVDAKKGAVALHGFLGRPSLHLTLKNRKPGKSAVREISVSGWMDAMSVLSSVATGKDGKVTLSGFLGQQSATLWIDKADAKGDRRVSGFVGSAHVNLFLSGCLDQTPAWAGGLVSNSELILLLSVFAN